MKKKNMIISIMLIATLIFSMSVSVFANDSDARAFDRARDAIFQDSATNIAQVVGNEQIEELRAIYEGLANRRDDQGFASRSDADTSFRDLMISINMQAEAHGFTDEQIKALIAGYIETTEDAFTVDTMVYSDTPTVSAPSRMSNELSMEYGPISIEPLNNNDLSTRNCGTGLGYEVRSRLGFRETTVFATVGRSNITAPTGAGAYMFHTIYLDRPVNNRVNDFGIAFFNNRWQVFVWGCWTNWGVGTPRFAINPGQQLYFMLTIENQAIRMRILDANNFSRVFWDQVYTTWSEVPNNGSNIAFNRQITIADDHRRNNSGFFLRDASFHSGHLYSTTGHAPYNNNNTLADRRGKFGASWAPHSRVNTFSNTRWSAERVSIHVTTGTPVF